MGISQLGGSSYSRLAMKQNAAGQTYALQTVTTGSGTNVGSWAVFVNPTSVEYYVTAISYTASLGFSSIPEAIFTVGIGTSGAESTIGMLVINGGPVSSNSTSSGAGIAYFHIPLRVASGSRLVVQASSNMGSSSSLATRLYLVPYANVEGN